MSIISNMKLFTKMITIVLAALLFLAAVGLVGFFYMDDMADNTNLIYEDHFIPLHHFTTLSGNVKETRAYIYEILLTEDAERIKVLSENIMQNSVESERAAAELNNVKNKTAEGIQLYNGILEVMDEFIEQRDHVIELALAGSNEEAYAHYMEHVRDLQNTIIANVEQLTERLLNNTAALDAQNRQNARTATQVIIGSFLIAAALLSLISWLITRVTVKPMEEIQELMQKAEEGDLTVRGTYAGQDEAGQLTRSFNVMMDQFNEVVSRIIHAANSVSAAAQQI